MIQKKTNLRDKSFPINGTKLSNAQLDQAGGPSRSGMKMAHFGFLLVFCSNLFAQDYVSNIMERNLFSPLRGEEPEVKPVESPELSLESTYVLDGTLIFPDEKCALVSEISKPNQNPTILGNRKNKRSAPKDSVETYSITLGESIGNYQVTKISRNSITMVNGEETIRLKLYSGMKTDRGGSKKVNESHNRSGQEFVTRQKKSQASKRPKKIKKPSKSRFRPSNNRNKARRKVDF